MVPKELEPPNGEPASLDLYRRPSLAIFVDSSLGIRTFYELPSICHDNQFRRNNSMKFEGKKSPRGSQRDKLWRIKGKSIAFDDAFLGGSSTWARTRDLRINRNPGSSKTYINQQLICKNSHRVIFRVIGQKLHIATGEVKT
jgi:hypothetical protein